jgi:hypothetical protein
MTMTKLSHQVVTLRPHGDPSAKDIVMNIVYDGCDSLRWLASRGLGDSEVWITINNHAVVFSQNALELKLRGS